MIDRKHARAIRADRKHAKALGEARETLAAREEARENPQKCVVTLRLRLIAMSVQLLITPVHGLENPRRGSKGAKRRLLKCTAAEDPKGSALPQATLFGAWPANRKKLRGRPSPREVAEAEDNSAASL